MAHDELRLNDTARERKANTDFTQPAYSSERPKSNSLCTLEDQIDESDVFVGVRGQTSNAHWSGPKDGVIEGQSDGRFVVGREQRLNGPCS